MSTPLNPKQVITMVDEYLESDYEPQCDIANRDDDDGEWKLYNPYTGAWEPTGIFIPRDIA